MDEIRKTPVKIWKEEVKRITIKIALDYLNSNVGSKSRKYSKLEMSPYLCPNDQMPIETAKFLAKAQSHMIENIKMNYQQEYKPNLVCNACKKSECNQAHLLICPALIGSNQLITYIPNYEDIFDDTNIEEQCFIANIMMENLKCKKKLDTN